MEKQKQPLSERVSDVVESEILDMSDEFNNNDVCEILRVICVKLIFDWKVFNVALVRELDTHYLHARTFNNEPDEEYNANVEELVGIIKVSSKREGAFISWSDSENTGIAFSCSCLYNGEMESYEIGTILSMVNEAWCNCKN